MKNKICIILLVIIILLQVIYKIYVDSGKEDFFVDEIYSYGLANYKQAFLFEEESFVNNWHKKEYFDDYVAVSEGDNFNRAYENQKEDYHPPLYYMLLRLVEGVSVGSFSKWTGLTLNIIIFITCAIILFLIGKKLFKNNIYALLLVFAYGFSRFSSENTLFIRMYQLLELQLLLLSYWGIRNCYNNKLKLKNIIPLIILIILGTLTQYYYLLFLIGFFVLFIIKYITRKQIKNLGKFIGAIIIAQILVYLIFPNYTEQLSGNSKRSSGSGVNAIEKVQEILSRENDYLKILDDSMFNFNIKYLVSLMLLVGIILLIVKGIKEPKRRIKLKVNKRLNIILIPTIVYWCLVTFTSPYIDLRYILPIFVFILIIIFYLLKKEIGLIIKNKKIIMAIFLIITMIYTSSFLLNTELRYQYKSSKEKIENISKYKDIPCIYMYAPTDVLTNTFTLNFNYVRQFEKVYIMNKINFSVLDVEKALKNVDISKGIIIMDNEVGAEYKAKKIVDEMEEFNNYKKIEEITIERTVNDEIFLIF